MNPDTLTAQALLNCLVREVSVPEEQAWEADGRLMVRLARSDRLLRVTSRRALPRSLPRRWRNRRIRTPTACLMTGTQTGCSDGGRPTCAESLPPVLHALFGHGIVLEPHLQNVLAGLDSDGLPAQAIFRDLEGVKLLSPRHDELLTTLKPGVAGALAYDPERGWNRVAYCLFVNHLAEIAAAIADRHPGPEDQLEADLWNCAHGVLAGFARDHGWPPQLRAVLAGVPLPAKANMRLRWARAADHEATYLRVLNPLSEHGFAWSRRMAVPCRVP